MKKVMIILIGLFLCVYVSTAQIEIKTIYHETYTGILIERGDSILHIKTLDGLNIDIPLVQIQGMTHINSTITTYTGVEYEGNITAITDTSYCLCTEFNDEIEINKLFIRSLETDNGFTVHPKVQSYALKRQDYTFYGLTAFCPGGINVLFGQQYRYYGIRFQGGYIPSALVGFQSNILFNISKEQNFESNFSIGVGYINLIDYKSISTYFGGATNEKEKDFKYAGLFYDANWDGFFMEIGAAVGGGDYLKPQILLQLGYVLRGN